jgi:hypothetical protein
MKTLTTTLIAAALTASLPAFAADSGGQPADSKQQSRMNKNKAEDQQESARQRIDATHQGVMRHCQALNGPAQENCIEKATADRETALRDAGGLARTPTAKGSGAPSDQKQQPRSGGRFTEAPGG